jgi:hypothetical protein
MSQVFPQLETLERKSGTAEKQDGGEAGKSIAGACASQLKSIAYASRDDVERHHQSPPQLTIHASTRHSETCIGFLIPILIHLEECAPSLLPLYQFISSLRGLQAAQYMVCRH